MPYALIDNASLTAVQRVLGEVRIKGPDTRNGDIAALENLVQALIFYDDIICIDNYKSEHKVQRASRFPFVRFIDPKEYNLSEVEEVSKRESEQIRPEIRGGSFADDDFKEFFRLLKMNIICTWDMQGSVYYLTMKMLGLPDTDDYAKYSELSASIFNELSDVAETRGRWSDAVKLVGSDGAVYEQKPNKIGRYGGSRKSLDMFVASLNWIAYKTIYYSLVAKHLKADSFLHPIRHAFQIHWMNKSGVYGHDFTSKLVETLASDVRAAVCVVMDKGRSTTVAIDLPLFSAYLASEAGDVTGVLEAAVQLRTNPGIEPIRQLLREIRLAFDEDGYEAANKKIEKWESELKKASALTRSTFGVKTPQGLPLSPLVAVYNSLAPAAGLPTLPDLKLRVAVPEVLKSPRSKSFGSFYKQIAKELATVERMGSLREILGRRFVFEDGWDERYVPPNTEDPKYRYIRSHWKEPM
jgi:hypothetical protein